jgi:hypothetical protein
LFQPLDLGVGLAQGGVAGVERSVLLSWLLGFMSYNLSINLYHVHRTADFQCRPHNWPIFVICFRHYDQSVNSAYDSLVAFDGRYIRDEYVPRNCVEI